MEGGACGGINVQRPTPNIQGKQCSGSVHPRRRRGGQSELGRPIPPKNGHFPQKGATAGPNGMPPGRSGGRAPRNGGTPAPNGIAPGRRGGAVPANGGVPGRNGSAPILGGGGAPANRSAPGRNGMAPAPSGDAPAPRGRSAPAGGGGVPAKGGGVPAKGGTARRRGSACGERGIHHPAWSSDPRSVNFAPPRQVSPLQTGVPGVKGPSTDGYGLRSSLTAPALF